MSQTFFMNEKSGSRNNTHLPKRTLDNGLSTSQEQNKYDVGGGSTARK